MVTKIDMERARPGLRNMASRLDRAEQSFITMLGENGFSADDAAIIARVYQHIGQLRFDAVDGQYYIRHGALLDHEMLRRCVEHADELLTTRPTKWKARRR